MKFCSAIKKILFVLLFILDKVKQNFIFRVRGPLVGGGRGSGIIVDKMVQKGETLLGEVVVKQPATKYKINQSKI